MNAPIWNLVTAEPFCRIAARLGLIVAILTAPIASADNTDSTAGADSAALVAKVYKGFETGDMNTILSYMAEDVEWIHPGPANIPFAGVFKGKQGVGQFFSRAFAELDVLEQKIFDFVVDGDTVAALGFEHMRVKSTGREYQSNWVHLYTVRDGHIVRFEEYIDTAAVSAGFPP